MRISLSMLFGLFVALGIFLVVQSFVAGSQFRTTTSQQLENSGLVSFSATQGLQVQNNGKPQKPTALREPALPPVISLAAVNPPAIAAPGMSIPDVDVPFGATVSTAPEERMAESSEATTPAASKPAEQEPVLRAGNLVLIHRVEPEYPTRAIRQRLNGSVTVKFTVEPDGSVNNPTVTKAVPRRGIFDDAAMRAVLKWKFKPIPTATETSVTLEFNLNLGQ